MKQPINTYRFLLLILFIWSFFSIKSFAQDSYDFNKRRERFYKSIEYLKNNHEDPTLRIWLRQYKNYEIAELKNYCKELQRNFSLQQAHLNKWQKIAWFYEIGHAQTNLDLVDSALISLNNALNLASYSTTPQAFFMIKFGIAFLYRQNNAPEKSNEVFSELLQLAIDRNDIKEQIHVKYWMVENLHKLGQYEKALEFSQELYKYSMENGDLVNASYNLIHLGQVAAKLDSDTSYLSYYHNAIKHAREGGAKNVIGFCIFSTAAAYHNEGYTKKALTYLKKAFEYKKHFTPRENIDFLNVLSSTYLAADSLQYALQYAEEALKQSKNIKGEQWQANALSNLAAIYSQLDQLDSALLYYSKSLLLFKQAKQLEMLISTYNKLSRLYTKKNNYKQALCYLDSSYQYYNEFTQTTNADILTKIRTESDYYLQKSEITKLSEENLVNKTKAKRLFDFSIGIAILLLIIIIFFSINRKRLIQLRESHLNLLKKNLELDTLNKQLVDCQAKPSKKSKSDTIKNKDHLQQQFHSLLFEKEIFCNPSLSLKSLASELNTNTTYLSSIINDHYKSNFKTLVNDLRIRKAKTLITSEKYKSMSMEGVAIEVGFKSRSGFYQSFKNFTGLTPTQYILNYQLMEKTHLNTK